MEHISCCLAFKMQCHAMPSWPQLLWWQLSHNGNHCHNKDYLFRHIFDTVAFK
jgi:hypothetical protein